MEEKKTIKEWKDAFAELYKAMRKELGASDLDGVLLRTVMSQLFLLI